VPCGHQAPTYLPPHPTFITFFLVLHGQSLHAYIWLGPPGSRCTSCDDIMSIHLLPALASSAGQLTQVITHMKVKHMRLNEAMLQTQSQSLTGQGTGLTCMR
jgi:hypothetical protein